MKNKRGVAFIIALILIAVSFISGVAVAKVYLYKGLLTVDVPIKQKIPVTINDSFVVPVKTTIPVDINDSFPINTAISTNVKIPIDETLLIDTTIPVQTTVPIDT